MATKHKQSVSSLHKDLVELSGSTAYQYPEVFTDIGVNQSKYKIIDTSYDNPSGFDAITVKNNDTEEYSIVFVGTEPAQDQNYNDIYTDAQLLSDLDIKQINEANQYYEEMKKNTTLLL
ncbi:hypothetical protein GKZ89_14890 [Bacillus mangrovi]|uniref:Uncharacterized protein n=1 Tax=Metabacillus mangrovi TaxID=1491830 RepID=A0A7X2V5D3_9BACI|nr:hypothetical protein [Metabacillus mangrovi]MTH54687.1 hypothetical protein [Metabacillus mangrovi]